VAVAAESDAAGRAENQDVALSLALAPASGAGPSEDFLLLVADGMGGEPAGDVASEIASRTVRDEFPTLPGGDLGQALKQAFRKANDAIYREAESDAAKTGMGTTLTAALLQGRYATIAHVGDSRAYLLRGEGLTQVTRDHSLVEEEATAGRMTQKAARNDPRRHILTHSLGSSARLDGKLPSIFELTLLPGDRLLLCTDGLYDVLDDVDMRRALANTEPTEAVLSLVQLAKERNTRDNATAVVAAAIPTRVPVAGTALPDESRTGGIPGAVLAGAMAVLLIILLILAVYLLGFMR
jgi:serine/threonine protein phosphatase PrpC